MQKVRHTVYPLIPIYFICYRRTYNKRQVKFFSEVQKSQKEKNYSTRFWNHFITRKKLFLHQSQTISCMFKKWYLLNFSAAPGQNIDHCSCEISWENSARLFTWKIQERNSRMKLFRWHTWPLYLENSL